jgi:hypothetical protein
MIRVIKERRMRGLGHVSRMTRRGKRVRFGWKRQEEVEY